MRTGLCLDSTLQHMEMRAEAIIVQDYFFAT